MTTRQIRRAFKRAGGYVELAGHPSEGWWYGAFLPSKKTVFWRGTGLDGKAYGWRIINRTKPVHEVTIPDPHHRLAVSEVVNWARP